MTPAFLHVFKRDIGRHFRGQRADGRRDFFLIAGANIVAIERKRRQQLVEVNPRGHRIVITQGELGLFPWQCEALDQAHPSVHTRQPAAAILNPAGDNFKSQTSPRTDVQTEQHGVNVRAECVDVVELEIFQLRAFGEQFFQDTIAE